MGPFLTKIERGKTHQDARSLPSIYEEMGTEGFSLQLCNNTAHSTPAREMQISHGPVNKCPPPQSIHGIPNKMRKPLKQSRCPCKQMKVKTHQRHSLTVPSLLLCAFQGLLLQKFGNLPTPVCLISLCKSVLSLFSEFLQLCQD